jgi:hypothetical protein
MRKYKVGQRVKFTLDDYVGHPCIIVYIRSSKTDPYPYEIKFINHEGEETESLNLAESELRPANCQYAII